MNESNASIKAVLVTNMVAPYRISFYNTLSELCDFTVLTDVESEFNRKWRLDSGGFLFRHWVMNSFSLVLPRIRKDLDYAEHRQMHFSEKLWFYLWRLRPDVVVSNELGLRSLGCMLYAKVMNCPWILMSEATNHTEGWVSWPKRLIRKLLMICLCYLHFWLPLACFPIDFHRLFIIKCHECT
jgi:hypothetical protein